MSTDRISWQEKYKVSVPEGKSGKWEVRRIVVSEEDSRYDKLHAMLSFSYRYTPPGIYTQLVRGNTTTVMSDTPNEIEDHLEFISRAEGNVLINGLGLGVALQGALLKDSVQHVTVIEIEEDVIRLVARHYIDMFGADRLTILHENALEWKPPKGVRYNAVWHDIWDYICTDNLPDMHTLHRKYGRRCDWQGSWARDILKYEQRREKSSMWGY